MASKPLSLILLLFLFLLISQTQVKSLASAQAPSSSTNLTAILESDGQYSTLLSLLNNFNLITEIQSQLNSTSEGLTLFAPTNNAFNHLAPNVLKNLTSDQKVKLLLYHVVPKYYLLFDLKKVSNPVKTLASEKEGSWGLKFTSPGNNVLVSTGVVSTLVEKALTLQFPLVVYQVDKVLLPLELFGTKRPSLVTRESYKAILFT